MATMKSFFTGISLVEVQGQTLDRLPKGFQSGQSLRNPVPGSRSRTSVTLITRPEEILLAWKLAAGGKPIDAGRPHTLVVVAVQLALIPAPARTLSSLSQEIS